MNSISVIITVNIFIIFIIFIIIIIIVIVVVVVVVIKTRGKTPVAKNNKNKLLILFPSVCYSGWSSSTKPSCSKTELKRCTTTEIRWNKNEDAQTSPVVSTNRQLPNSLKN